MLLKIFKPGLLKSIFFFFFLTFGAKDVFSQWKYASADNIRDEINIMYDVVYERELTKEEKKSSHYKTEHSVTFNKNKLLLREFPHRNSSDRYVLLDYENKNAYSCSSSSNSKTALKSAFKKPKK